MLTDNNYFCSNAKSPIFYVHLINYTDIHKHSGTDVTVVDIEQLTQKKIANKLIVRNGFIFCITHCLKFKW